MKRIILVSILSVITACASVQLTSSGKNVDYVTKQEAPKNCKKIGEITTEEDPMDFKVPPKSVSQVKIVMRNKTANMGGNYLVIDTIEKKDEYVYHGTGRAYNCKQ